MSDLFAKDAIIRIGRSLRTAVADGNNLGARYDMAIGSLYGGMAITNAGVTAVHAMAYPLGGQFGVAHGVANGLLLPYVMEYNLETTVQKHIDIAQAMGVVELASSPFTEANSMSSMEAAKSAIDAVRKLSQDIGIPQRLKNAGVKEESIPVMARKAMADHCHSVNPRECTEEAMAAIYKAAF